MATTHGLLSVIKAHLVGHAGLNLHESRVRIEDIDGEKAARWCDVNEGGSPLLCVFITPLPYEDRFVAGEKKEADVKVAITVAGPVNPDAEAGELEQLLPHAEAVLAAIEELEPNSLAGAEEFRLGVVAPLGFEDHDNLAALGIGATIRRFRQRGETGA